MQFGASIGGPLVKDRTFVFVAPEFQRNTKQVETLYAALDSQKLRGVPAAQELLRVAPEGQHQALSQSRSVISRLDHRLNDRHGLMARFDSRKYEVEATPTFVFTDSHGNELFRHTGLLMADRLLPLLEALPRDVTRINQLGEAIARKNDFSSLVALGQELRSAGLYRASNQYHGRALRTRSAGQNADARARILLDMGRNHAELQEAREAARAFERFLREFGGHSAEPEALLALAEALLAQNKPAEARQRLQALMSRHQGTPAAAEAARLIKRIPES